MKNSPMMAALIAGISPGTLMGDIGGLPEYPLRPSPTRRDRGTGTGLCACGCGAVISANKEYKQGHGKEGSATV